ncbi:hypothetical protein HWC44_gp097 [Mycobacterium phage ThetaBob]|uniref:Uncharacterized protein n=1 Tax=Mycobacterium phage ThetaBob TaxID=2588513 RepID=A0A4Y6EX32_9CAUD|nr:hypothetical protein HWC44_gp097 [Mycobacterium phage ThetaBob]QDF19984.1 hypothetical protein SEA_THETABOB_97 [Mycobacterium phage ThetaBob]
MIRQQLLEFATWLLKDETGEGHEAEIVDRYLTEHPQVERFRTREEALQWLKE